MHFFKYLKEECSQGFIIFKQEKDQYFFDTQCFFDIEFFPGQEIVLNGNFKKVYKLSKSQYIKLLNIYLQSVIKVA